MNEHVLDELEAYALGALDRADAERVAEHIASCAACRSDAAALAEVVDTLPEMVSPREPRPALRDRILASARVETRAPAPVVSRPWSFGAIRASRIAFAGLLGSIILLGAADLDAYQRTTAVTAERDQLYGLIESMRQGGREWYMAGNNSFSGAGGTLYDPRAEGKQPFVLFHDLPPVATGKVLTVWLVSPDSTWARAATFKPNGQDIQAVGINMEVSGFDRCAVTLEDSSWGPRYGAVVMESRIAPPTTTP
jgi:anti-sigma-K factor RskA/putative zinc finger protein